MLLQLVSWFSFFTTPCSNPFYFPPSYDSSFCLPFLLFQSACFNFILLFLFRDISSTFFNFPKNCWLVKMCTKWTQIWFFSIFQLLHFFQWHISFLLSFFWRTSNLGFLSFFLSFGRTYLSTSSLIFILSFILYTLFLPFIHLKNIFSFFLSFFLSFAFYFFFLNYFCLLSFYFFFHHLILLSFFLFPSFNFVCSYSLA